MKAIGFRVANCLENLFSFFLSESFFFFLHLLSKGQNMVKRVTKYEVDFRSFLYIFLSSGSLLMFVNGNLYLKAEMMRNPIKWL